jgi:SAM-dependent methyltransferase
VATHLQPWELALVETDCTDRGAANLNVGCGAGRETFALYNMGYRNVRGIDRTPALLQAASQRATELELPVRFAPGQAAALPFGDNAFDVITLFQNVFGHITPRSEPVRSLREIRRVLKPGGLVFVEATSLHHRYRHRFYIRLFDLLRHLHNPGRMEPGDKTPHDAPRPTRAAPAARPRTHWFAPGKIPAEVQEAGLTVIRSSTRQAIVSNPHADARAYHRQVRLIYVLRR